MKSAVFAASLMAALAIAKPLDKRYWIYETDYFTDTVTVTAWPTQDGQDWHHWGQSSAEAPATTSTTPAAATTTAPSTPPAWTTSPAESPSAAWTSNPAPATTAVSSAAPAGTLSSYAQPILDQHNNHRMNHSVPALTWSDSMASIAQTIAASCVYAHNTQAGGGGYGQNIGAGALPSAVPALITNEMYNDEIGWYPLPYGVASPDMSNFEKWGHFSQIVWKSTTSVGCYTQYCPNGLANTGSGVAPYFTVCNYSPPGNFAGEYGANVLAPHGEAVVVVPS